MNTLKTIFLLSSLGLASQYPGVALAAEGAGPAAAPSQLSTTSTTTPTTPPAPTTPPTETRWYAGQMGAVYAGSLALCLAHSARQGDVALFVTGELGILLVPPILHGAHDNGSGLAASLVLRGLLVLTLLGWEGNCFNPFGPSPESTNCHLLAVAGFVELVAIPVVDFTLARETVEKPASRLSLLVLPPSGSRPGLVSVAARF